MTKGVFMADFELPIFDFTDKFEDHTVIAEGGLNPTTEYQGHPTTVLTRSGKLICVWCITHGGPCGPAAESLDYGKTWTRIDDRLPESYASTHRNCPTLQKCDLGNGKERLFIFSAKVEDSASGLDSKMPQIRYNRLAIVYSDDDGSTWQEAEPADLSSIMPPTGFLTLKDGSLALFGQIKKYTEEGIKEYEKIWMSISHDFGLTWSEGREIAISPKHWLCEPFAFRSPDGDEICVLIRENSHKGRSMVIFSRDEGKTWTAPVETPLGLTGDRHEGVYLSDGRLFIAFRDRAIGSPTYGQYVAWVGEYGDIRFSRPGQYRIHLLRHYGKPDVWPGNPWDTGYSGVELLPGGSVLCTTYVKYWDDDRYSSVVSTLVTPP